MRAIGFEQTMQNAVDTNDFVELVRQAGLRPTRQRLSLARQLFMNGDRHVTAERLHSESLDQGISVSLATVYNTLHQFTAAGLLREIVVDSQRSYFDTNMTDHHHFFFEGSGELKDIPGDQVVVAGLPAPPPGMAVKRVDIVVRMESEKIFFNNN